MTVAASPERQTFNGAMVRVRPARIESLVTEGRVRVARVLCCYCSKIHEHVVPEDIVQSAPLVRTARCKGAPDYRLILPGDWTEEHELQAQGTRPKAAGPREYVRKSLEGTMLGGLPVLCDGPDFIRESDPKGKKRRRIFGRCECGNVALVEVQAKAQSCGCKRGRPTDDTAQYDAWVASQGQTAKA
ncbi:hypothetical protein G5V59_09995 [Nocardioides sp. W3-2-3]|uniref:hypothetical protein n=1 Tax=Nocardioides convexus TaxID=2712224 RepID=UPI0024184BA6|nr:hypothetical protein [Nocardioides convexus]NHA00327.1 hypothetical protein [Nocardioides convexus]